MSARWLIPVIVAVCILPAARLLADDALATDNSKAQFEGEITGTNVIVRSGPDAEQYYATQRLDKGAKVTVVGIKNDWLKITPPEGSFCYIAAADVQLSPDAKGGKITRNANIRAGSQLNTMKTTVLGQLSVGDTVDVIGREENYLKIKPPAGSYLYVNQQYVRKVRILNETAAASPTADPGTPTQTQTPAPISQDYTKPAPTVTNNPAAPKPMIDGPIATATPSPTAASPATVSPLPASPQAAPQGASAAAPATQPTQVAAAPATQPVLTDEDKFGNFEAEFAELTKQPLADQKIALLVTKYQSIEKSDDLSVSLKQVVTVRIATLQARSQSQAKLVAERQQEKDQKDKELAQTAEQQELAEKLRQTAIQLYAAVGTVQVSSLQVGGGVLFRLTDPGTGRTMIYIKGNAEDVSKFVGKFVGINGDQTTDAQLNLRFITPKQIDQIDPAKVNNSIAAEMVPPSLMARTAGARSTPEN